MIDGPKIRLEDFGELHSDHDASSYYCICVPSCQLFVLVSSSCLPRQKKLKKFCTGGISLCLDPFQNAISSVMAALHVRRSEEEPPLLRFPRHKWECAICLLKCPAGPNNRSASPSVISLSGVPRQYIYPHQTFPICRSRGFAKRLRGSGRRALALFPPIRISPTSFYRKRAAGRPGDAD